MKKFTLLTITCILLAITIGGCITTSDGIRVGYVTKFSHKGLFTKTWEGELNLAGGNTMTTGTWAFSLDNSANRGENIDSLVAALTAAAQNGSRVEICYQQELFVAGWRGHTNYLVQKVKVLE